MQYDKYDLKKASADLCIFYFISIGPKGNILKRLEFQETIVPGVYNLCLGDIDEAGEYDDLNVSNNHDRNLVLATVAGIIDIHLQKYPYHWILIEGNTTTRTRLYRMVIGANFRELSARFDIYTQQEGRLIPFSKNMPADNFIIRLKKN